MLSVKWFFLAFIPKFSPFEASTLLLFVKALQRKESWCLSCPLVNHCCRWIESFLSCISVCQQHGIVFFFFFLFLAHSWRCSGEHGMLGIKPGSSTCKANTLPYVLLLQPVLTISSWSWGARTEHLFLLWAVWITPMSLLLSGSQLCRRGPWSEMRVVSGSADPRC